MRKRWRAVAWPSHFFLQVALSKHGDGKYKSSTTELGIFFFCSLSEVHSVSGRSKLRLVWKVA